jgi:hypothetical protein
MSTPPNKSLEPTAAPLSVWPGFYFEPPVPPAVAQLCSVRPLRTFTMKPSTQSSSSKLRQLAARVGLAKCAPDKHDWVFFDNFPCHEIFECRICRLKKFVDLKTGRESFE